MNIRPIAGSGTRIIPSKTSSISPGIPRRHPILDSLFGVAVGACTLIEFVAAILVLTLPTLVLLPALARTRASE